MRPSGEERRIIALAALFVVAAAVIGIGAFLLGTRQTTEMVSGGAGISGNTSPPTVQPTTSLVATTEMPTTSTEAPPISPAPPATAPPSTTTAPALSGTPETTTIPATAPTTAPTTTPTTVPPDTADNSTAARADLQLHFDNHDRLDLDAAYTGLTESFAPPFDEFVRFWSVDVAAVNSPIDSCEVTGDRGVCAVRFFISYSNDADEGVRNRCLGQSVELTMQRTNGRFLIDEQRNLGPLDCPTT